MASELGIFCLGHLFLDHGHKFLAPLWVVWLDDLDISRSGMATIDVEVKSGLIFGMLFDVLPEVTIGHYC
jgi:hypothetical protein